MQAWGSRRGKFAPISVVVAALILTFALAAEAHAAGPKLKLRRQRGHGEAQRIEVYILSRAMPVGAYTLEVSFDPAQAQLVSIESGNTPEFSSAPISNRESYESGKVRFSAFQTSSMDGPTGRVQVATLVFKSVPGARTRRRSRIKVKAVTLADTKGRPFAVEERSKTIQFAPRRR